jgi:hypothetical protein
MTKTQPERLAYSVGEFCKAVGISRSFYYKIEPHQRPKESRIERRVLITAEAAREWLRRNATVPA